MWFRTQPLCSLRSTNSLFLQTPPSSSYYLKGTLLKRCGDWVRLSLSQNPGNQSGFSMWVAEMDGFASQGAHFRQLEGRKSGDWNPDTLMWKLGVPVVTLTARPNSSPALEAWKMSQGRQGLSATSVFTAELTALK